METYIAPMVELHIGTYWTRKIEPEKVKEQLRFAHENGKDLVVQRSKNGGNEKHQLLKFLPLHCNALLENKNLFDTLILVLKAILENKNPALENALRKLKEIKKW